MPTTPLHIGFIGAVAKAINLARSCGVDPARMRAAFEGGFAWSRVTEPHGQRMIDERFGSGGEAATQPKGAAQTLSPVKRQGARMPATRLGLGLYDQMVSPDWGDLDHSALIRILE